MKRPDWCPHPNCKFNVQSQDKMCIGELPNPVKHDNDLNTHRLCINTRETGHEIFDLQINWTDCWNLMRLLNTVKDEINKL